MTLSRLLFAKNSKRALLSRLLTDSILSWTVTGKIDTLSEQFSKDFNSYIFIRVMVLDKGEIREFASPDELLANNKSIFYGMAKDAGLV